MKVLANYSAVDTKTPKWDIRGWRSVSDCDRWHFWWWCTRGDAVRSARQYDDSPQPEEYYYTCRSSNSSVSVLYSNCSPSHHASFHQQSSSLYGSINPIDRRFSDYTHPKKSKAKQRNATTPQRNATQWKPQSAQDVNGDGFDDVMVGAWGASSAAGEIMVVFGSSTFSAVVVGADLDGSQGFLVRGATTSDAAGFSLAAAGVRHVLGFGLVLVLDFLY